MANFFSIIHIISFYSVLVDNLRLHIYGNNKKCAEAQDIVYKTTIDLYIMFDNCVGSTMPSQQFLVDNIKSFVNYPSKTTIGFAPKFTTNRKFFANMISTPAFKDMLAKDEDKLRKDLIKKLKYCDVSVMDPDLLKEFYDREVDQSKV